jgi:hypothetical protein
MRDDAKIRVAMAALRDAERLLREAHMPATAGGVTKVRVWLRWCLAPKSRHDINEAQGYKKPEQSFSEIRSRGRRRNARNYD